MPDLDHIENNIVCNCDDEKENKENVTNWL